MRKDIESRLSAIESQKNDWVSQLDTVDYGILEDNYENGEWEELHFDSTITVLRNKESGEVRGVYADRRTDEEILSEGGSLEYR